MEQIERFIALLPDRNWLDLGVLLVIGVYFLIGLSSGLIYSAFRLVSSAIALYMSVSFYDRLAGFVYGTYAETVIDAFIYDGFLSNPVVSAAQYEANVDNALNGIIDMLMLPNGVAEAIFTVPARLTDVQRTIIFDNIDIVGYLARSVQGRLSHC